MFQLYQPGDRGVRLVYSGVVDAQDYDSMAYKIAGVVCVFAEELNGADLDQKVWAARARDSMRKARGILPPEEIGYQMHDGQDREAPPHHGQETGPWKEDRGAREEDLHEDTGDGDDPNRRRGCRRRARNVGYVEMSRGPERLG